MSASPVNSSPSPRLPDPIYFPYKHHDSGASTPISNPEVFTFPMERFLKPDDLDQDSFQDNSQNQEPHFTDQSKTLNNSSSDRERNVNVPASFHELDLEEAFMQGSNSAKTQLEKQNSVLKKILSRTAGVLAILLIVGLVELQPILAVTLISNQQKR